MKKCIFCKNIKDLNEFHSHKSRPDGKNNICKECRRLRGRKEWESKTDLEDFERFKKNIFKNDSSKLENKRSFFQNETRLRMAYAKFKNKSQEDLNETVIRRVYRMYKKNGYKEGLDSFKDITKNNCFYCGIAPCKETIGRTESRVSCFQRKGKFVYNGIDRVDNKKGYEKENIVPCCNQCNLAKKDLSLEEWNEWLDRIASYRKERGK